MRAFYNVLVVFSFVFWGMGHAQVKMPEAWQSSFINITSDGKLVYHPDKLGNVIPDFSKVGYHHGERSIPCRTSVTKTIFPVSGVDNAPLIQKAIDEIAQLPPDANGYRGTLLLEKGVYPIYSTIYIRQGGIVLTGVGDNVNETRLLALGKKQYAMISVSGMGERQELSGTRVKIVDSYVPVGAVSFEVSSTEVFREGDTIVVYRPGTDRWIHDLQMDRIVERHNTLQWKPSEYNLAYERRIVGIDGNRIYIDNPVVMQMEEKYGGGEVYKYRFDGRIREVGVMNMCLESEFEHYEDIDHGWIGVLFDKVENCWASNLTCRYLGYSAVMCDTYAKNVTVTDCRSLEAKSVIRGGKRYSFCNNGQQNLYMNCLATEGRHDFVTGARVCGPNVFYNCVSYQSYADIGPHLRWSSGTLYDNVYTDGEINVQDRANWGTGHGWAGVTQVLWNCRAKSAVVQSPWVSGDNYCIGFKGEKVQGREAGRPDGRWEGQGETNVFPRSLYVAQLMARKNMDLRILTK